MESYCFLVRQYAKSQLGKMRIGKCSTVPGKDRLSVAHFTVHSFYRRAHLSGLWDSILTHLVKLTRQKADSHRLYWLLNITLEKYVQMAVIAILLSTRLTNISACEWKYSRLLRKDYELSVTSAQTLIKISHIHTLLKRL